MTAAENQLDVLREAHRAFKNAAYFHDYPASIYEDALAALSAVEQLVEAARRLNDKRAYPIQRDWTALDAALARFPVPAQDTGGET